MSTARPTAAGSKPIPSIVLSPQPASFADRFVDFWWVRIPARLRRFSTLLWAAWSDGIYLTAWPRVATALVFGVFLFGFVEGSTHWSYRTIVGWNGFAGNVLAPAATANDWGGPTRYMFADNLVLLMVAVGVGSLSANLGLTLVLGWVLGDLIYGPIATGAGWRTTGWLQAWVYRHVPFLVTYVLFAILAALLIVMAMELARSFHPRVRRSRALTVALTAITQAFLVYCWGTVAPMVFRTVAFWSGGDPRITVPYYSEIIATWLVPVAVVGVVVRNVLFRRGVSRPEVLAGIRAVGKQARRIPVLLPTWARAIMSAALVTLLLTGFFHDPMDWGASAFSNFLEAEIVFLALAFALFAAYCVLPYLDWWRKWTAAVNRYPALLRLAAATAATYALCFLIISIPGLQSDRGGQFGPEVTAILLGIGLTVVLLPNGWYWLPPTEQVLPRLRPLGGSPLKQTAAIAFVVFFIERKMFADCYDYQCCFAAIKALAAGAAAGGIPGLGGIAGGAAPSPGATAGSASSDDSSKDPWWKRVARGFAPKSIDLPGGFHFSTDKPKVGWGGSVDIGDHVSGDVGVDVAPTPGSDPTGGIISVTVNANAQVHGATEGPGVEVGGSDTVTVGISQPVQDAVRSQGGGSAAQQTINESNNECSDGTLGNCGT